MTQERLRDECVHYTGVFTGRCRAGVSYDDVRDQDRRDQFARFPCMRSLSSFTTCDRAQFVRIEPRHSHLELSEASRGRTIYYQPEKGSRRWKFSGVLLGWTQDERTLYVEKETRTRMTVKAVPAERCSFERPATWERRKVKKAA